MTLTCPYCDDEIDVTVTHDPGCRYTRNGDGWPESWECEYTHDCITPDRAEAFEQTVYDRWQDERSEPAYLEE